MLCALLCASSYASEAQDASSYGDHIRLYGSAARSFDDSRNGGGMQMQGDNYKLEIEG